MYTGTGGSQIPIVLFASVLEAGKGKEDEDGTWIVFVRSSWMTLPELGKTRCGPAEHGKHIVSVMLPTLNLRCRLISKPNVRLAVWC